MKKVRIEIGGVSLLFRYKNSRLQESNSTELYMKDFIQPGSRNDFTIDLKVVKLPKYSKRHKLFEAWENWRVYSENGNCVLEERNDRSGINKICIMQKKMDKAKCYILPKRGEPDSWSLNSFMRILGQVIFTSILPRFHALMVHSCGVIIKGQGMIFCGVSGAGKTTISKLWQKRENATVLSDDRVIVRQEKKGYFIYGTPWPGEGKAVSPQRVRLKRIIFISKAKRNKLVPMERRKSLRRLVTTCFPPLWDKNGLDSTIKFCGRLAKDVPSFSFGFVPDESAVEFIESIITDDHGLNAR